MSVTLNASTSAGFIQTADTSGTIELQNNGTTRLTVNSGGVTIPTLKDSSGVLATQNGMTGIAKAWVNFNGTGTVAIRDSFNVSSITDNGTGDYTVNFTTAMPNANYVVASANFESQGVFAGSAFGVRSGTVPTTTAVRGSCISYTGSYVDPSYVFVAIFSS